MSLTNTQLQTLKSYILADPTLGPLTSGPGTDYGAIAAAMSELASPVVKAWPTNHDPQKTDAVTPWTAFDSITPAGKRESWIHAFLRYPRDYSNNAIRKWVTDVWGNATAASAAETILNGVLQDCTRVEAVIGGPTRTTGTVSAMKRQYEGGLSIADVAAMFNA